VLVFVSTVEVDNVELVNVEVVAATTMSGCQSKVVVSRSTLTQPSQTMKSFLRVQLQQQVDGRMTSVDGDRQCSIRIVTNN